MTFNLANMKPSKAILPPRVVLYSTPKWGKTTFASTIPHNIVLDVEGGSGALSVNRIAKDKLSTFGDLINVVKAVENENHSFQAITLDTLDWAEQLIFEQAAKEHGKTSIADVGYGAGYVTATNLWKYLLEQFDALREKRNMMVLLLAHEKVSRYDNPLTESYDRYSLKMHDKTVGIVKEWCDVLAFGNNEVFIKSEEVGFKQKVKRANAGDRIIHTVESPAFVAGNRYGLPSEIPVSWDALNDELTKAMMA